MRAALPDRDIAQLTLQPAEPHQPPLSLDPSIASLGPLSMHAGFLPNYFGRRIIQQEYLKTSKIEQDW
jgi:hypothetical protein